MFQPEIAVRVNDRGEVRAKLGFAADDALNLGSPFAAAAPFASDLESDVTGINGRDRDVLLIGEYTHELLASEAGGIRLTAGILDATEFLDENAFANDELRQFLNSAFVNDPIGFIPSFDVGAAATWAHHEWSAAALASRLGTNGDGHSYSFYGGQVGYHFGGEARAGNVRLTVTGTSSDFRDRADTADESRFGVSVSADHAIGGDGLGVFGRLGWQDDAAAVDFDAALSGGVVLAGSAWGRVHDVVGLGVAWLDGGNGNFDAAIVAELYAGIEVAENLVVSLDAQFFEESLVAGSPAVDPGGWIFGVRMTLDF